MPFTPSHVAAALPFLRTPLIPAAVVVGSMAPDIPYFVPLFIPRDLSHSLLGLVTVDLALGIVATLVWWVLLREPVVDLLPRRIGMRIPAVSRSAWRDGRRPGRHPRRPRESWSWAPAIALLVASCLVGSATHLLWDSFTHPGWVVDHAAFLRRQLGPLPVDKWLQHLSSVSGLAIVAVWSARWLRRAASDAARATRFRPALRHAAWGLVIAAGLAGGLIPWIRGMASGIAPFDASLVFLVARLGIGVAGAAAAVAVVLWYLLPRRPRADPVDTGTLVAGDPA